MLKKWSETLEEIIICIYTRKWQIAAFFDGVRTNKDNNHLYLSEYLVYFPFRAI